MDPSMVQAAQQMMSDPEIMSLLQDPDVMQRFQEFSANPQGNMHMLSDPTMMSLMTRMQQLMGSGGMGGMGGGMGSGMGGMGGMSGMSRPTPTSSTAAHPSNYFLCNSLAEIDSIFSKASQKGLPVVVNFSATWCGPCKRIAPIYESTAREYVDRCYFVKVDGDRATDAVNTYNVSGFPTFKFFYQGTCHETFSGANVSELHRCVSQIITIAEDAKIEKNRTSYQHFPLKENEIVLFKAIQYDKLLEKIKSTEEKYTALVKANSPTSALDEAFPGLHAALLEHKFTSCYEFSTVLSRFIAALQRSAVSDPILLSAVSMRAFGVMFIVPSLFNTALHILRMFTLLAPGATAVIENRIPVPTTATSPTTSTASSSSLHLVQFLTSQAIKSLEISPGNTAETLQQGCYLDISTEKSRIMSITLLLRCIANMFDRLALAKAIMSTVEDMSSLYSMIMLHCTDNNIINGIYGILINLVIVLTNSSFVSKTSTSTTDSTTAIQSPSEIRTYLLSVLYGSFFESDDLIKNENIVYKSLLILGTLLIGENGKTNEELLDLAIGLDFPSRCETIASIHSTKDNIVGACKELQKILTPTQ